MVEGFMALRKVATATALGHMPLLPLTGAMETTSNAPAFLSGSLHPVPNTSSRTAINQIVELLYLRMNFILLSPLHNCRCIITLALGTQRLMNWIATKSVS